MVDFSFFREKKKVLLPVAGVLIFLILLVGGRMFFEKVAESRATVKDGDSVVDFLEDLDNQDDKEKIDDPLTPERVSPLTGLEIDADADVRPVAVMIENHPASRAQMRGLNDAGIVIEALSEGGITRFLAIFDTSVNKKVGPVRSARPYFIDWAEEFGGAFVHAGGSEEALEELKTTSLLDLDEDGDIVYRDFRYLKPHNLFVNLAAVREENFIGNLSETWFDFSDQAPEGVSAKEFSIDFSLPSYFVDYVYDPVAGKYHRLLGGIEHTANGNPVRPTNVIIQFTEYWPIDDEGRLDLKTDGNDVAWYFSGGKMWRGVWKKTDGRTQFFDGFGSQVALQPGQTFIEVLDTTSRVKIAERKSTADIEAETPEENDL